MVLVLTESKGCSIPTKSVLLSLCSLFASLFDTVRFIGDRVLRNDFTAEGHGRNDEVVMQREALRHQVITAMKEGNPRLAAVRAGHAVGLIHEVQAAGDIIRQVVAEAEQLLRERPGQVLQE